jgi:hypothetical protein
MAGIADLQGMMGGAPEAPASAPPAAEPAETQVSGEAISALGRAFNSLSVEEITDLRNLSDDLKTMASDKLTVLEQTIQFIMDKSDQYDRAVQTLIQQGIVEPGDLPPKYVQSFFEILAGMVKDAIASPAAVPMEGPAAEMPPLAMAGGGIADLRSQADMVRRANRSGDSILAHINPREAEMLGRTQGSSINPITGLPEYGFFDSIGKFFKKAAGVILPVALNFLAPGLGTIASGVIGSGLGAMINGANPSQALQAGLMGGVAGGVFSGVSGMLGGGTFMGGLQGGLPSGMFGNPQTPFLNQNIFGGGGVTPTTTMGRTALPGGSGMPPSGAAVAPTTAAQAGGGFLDSVGNYITTNPKTAMAIAGGAGLLLGGALTPEEKKAEALKQSTVSPESYEAMRFRGATASTPYTGNVRVETNSPNPYYNYARGGQIEVDARVGGHLKGPGTGTSDSIPAKLSDGEFVMTAKAVKGAGGGSRAAGAKRMYDMMHQFEKRA